LRGAVKAKTRSAALDVWVMSSLRARITADHSIHDDDIVGREGFDGSVADLETDFAGESLGGSLSARDGHALGGQIDPRHRGSAALGELARQLSGPAPDL
jgi:hypothetical protein